jgi:hypothetical protein
MPESSVQLLVVLWNFPPHDNCAPQNRYSRDTHQLFVLVIDDFGIENFKISILTKKCFWCVRLHSSEEAWMIE